MYIYRSWKKFVTTHNNNIRTSHQSEVLCMLQFSASKFLSNSSAKSKLNFHGCYYHILTRSWEWNLLVFNKTQVSVTKFVHKRRAHVFGFFHAWILCSLLNFCDPCSRVCEEQINICSEIAQNRLSVWWVFFPNLSALKCTALKCTDCLIDESFPIDLFWNAQIVCLISFFPNWSGLRAGTGTTSQLWIVLPGPWSAATIPIIYLQMDLQIMILNCNFI